MEGLPEGCRLPQAKGPRHIGVVGNVGQARLAGVGTGRQAGVEIAINLLATGHGLFLPERGREREKRGEGGRGGR